MSGERDFERRLETIERGIRELEASNDPGLRAAAQQVVQAVMEIHAQGLERLLEIVYQSSGSTSIIDRLGRDPLVSPLLVLHSLHPLTLEARVFEAIEDLGPMLQSKHARAEVSGVVDGVVHVRFVGGPEERAAVERALLDAAPDAAGLEIEGAAEAVVGFVPVNSLRASGSARRLA